MLRNVLLICIGNICRSPMAEALLSDLLNNKVPIRPPQKISENEMQEETSESNILIQSAGLAAIVGAPADQHAQELMLERGLDLSSHRARQVSYEMLLEAELILTMSTRQREQINSTLPTICGKVHRLGKWDNFDVPDPYQGTKADFASALTLIEQGLNSWYSKLWNGNVKID